MKRFHVDISSVQSALEERPKVFQAVRVDVALCVANGMVYNATVVIALKIIIGHKRVGADSRTLCDVLTNVAAKLRSARVWNHLQNHLGMFVGRCPFQDALHCGLFESGVSNACALILVHVTGFCTDIGLVCLNIAGELSSDALVPRRSARFRDGSVNFRA